MASRAYRSAGLIRSLTLLWSFVLASGTILVVAALVLSSVLTQHFREQAMDDRGREVALYTSSVLTPALVSGKRLVARRPDRWRLTRTVRSTPEFRQISVWSSGGRFVVSTAPRRQTPRPGNDIAPALLGKRAVAEISLVSTGRGRATRATRALIVWSSLRTSSGHQAGIAQFVIDPTLMDAKVASASRMVWFLVGVVFVILWLALVLLVRGAAARLSRQNDDLEERSRQLVESSRLVEDSLLETIETLNAAVEARDPYTAGHSQRVRRVALAIARELQLPAKQIGSLGTAALFHDVGKIGIPDSILTKAGPLQPAEAAVMREHVTRGAEIVSKVSSFLDAVPAIRYHHERWDGLGYPDGLHGDDIPLEAAIIGLADAWDAMTTDRPYAHGLSLNEAMLQIRSGRGKQFSPVVVDAFWQVARRRPSDVLPPEQPATVVAAV